MIIRLKIVKGLSKSLFKIAMNIDMIKRITVIIIVPKNLSMETIACPKPELEE